MKFFSLKNPSFAVSFKEAVLRGQAPEKGLFFPEKIPRHSAEFLNNWKEYPDTQIAYEVIHPFVGDDITSSALERIIKETLCFDFPLQKVNEKIYALELFHGPTLAFKDVGARFLSRCLEYFVSQTGQKITILVATSGDTGSAVADAFHNTEGIEVFILFPSGKVSEVQRLQLTTYRKNIKALEVDGTFDDCQSLVKQAFNDNELNKKYQFNSANSINIARWLPQQFYYYFGLKQWPFDSAPVISVPSGNFGNLCAGILALRRGIPIKNFIAACNENDPFVRYLATQKYEVQHTVQTVSNAMDVGSPSNFERTLALFHNDFNELKKFVHGYSFTSAETLEAIKTISREQGYIADPHGAVGYLALKRFIKEHPEEAGIFMETAHPSKFREIVQPLVDEEIPVPKSIQSLTEKVSTSHQIAASFEEFKSYLMS